MPFVARRIDDPVDRRWRSPLPPADSARSRASVGFRDAPIEIAIASLPSASAVGLARSAGAPAIVIRCAMFGRGFAGSCGTSPSFRRHLRWLRLAERFASRSESNTIALRRFPARRASARRSDSRGDTAGAGGATVMRDTGAGKMRVERPRLSGATFVHAACRLSPGSSEGRRGQRRPRRKSAPFGSRRRARCRCRRRRLG